MQLLSEISTWFILFIIYSIIGWVFEIIVTSVETRKITNRGFLIGPICPIYGFGALIFSFVLGDIDNLIVIFCVSLVGAVILEYLTSYFMERLFHVRWWDYSKNAFNLNGRVCLLAAIVFGLLGVIIVRFVNPVLLDFLNHTNDALRILIAFELFCILLADIIVSLWLIFKMKVTVGTVSKDATAEISERVREIVMQKGKLDRRLVKAFPNMKAKTYHPKAKTSRRKPRKPSRTA